MKSNLWSRIRAAGCCAAFSLVLFLGGCTSAASSTSTAPSSSSQALSEAPTSQVVPSGEDDTAPAPSIDATENGFNGLTDPTEAFSRGLGWGPGTAGTSLKQAAAAANDRSQHDPGNPFFFRTWTHKKSPLQSALIYGISMLRKGILFQ